MRLCAFPMGRVRMQRRGSCTRNNGHATRKRRLLLRVWVDSDTISFVMALCAFEHERKKERKKNLTPYGGSSRLTTNSCPQHIIPHTTGKKKEIKKYQSTPVRSAGVPLSSPCKRNWRCKEMQAQKLTRRVCESSPPRMETRLQTPPEAECGRKP